MVGAPVRVGVNGYGVIGKRVADAVRAQPDMALVGVSDVADDYRIKTADVLGLHVFASTPEAQTTMRAAGLPVAGGLDELLQQVDVIVDCTPRGMGATNLARYRHASVKAVLQGGERHDATGHSFVADATCASALGREATRVVSCNTTSTVRTLGALRRAGLLHKARGVLIRRGTDPWEADRSGIMNTVVPEPHIPSHQGRPRGDLWEVAVWEDVLAVQGREAFYTYQVFNEAIVVPETVDAIRALTGRITDGAASMALTDRVLGVRRDLLARTPESVSACGAPVMTGEGGRR